MVICIAEYLDINPEYPFFTVYEYTYNNITYTYNYICLNNMLYIYFKTRIYSAIIFY